MLLEKERSQQDLFEHVADWLYAKAKELGITFKVTTDGIEERQGDYYTHILVPVSIQEDMDAYDKAKTLGKLERLWNDHEPRPEKLLFPYPAGVPRNAV